MKVMAAYSDKFHGEVSARKMSHKWGVGLEISKANFDVMTQINVRLAIFSLTNRYRNYLLSNKLRRFIVKFYNGSLIDDDTSLRGNKCAQI